jgi:hypothetical protein
MMITMVIPQAHMAMMELWRITFIRFRIERNPGMNEPATMNTAARTAYSRYVFFLIGDFIDYPFH